MILRPIDPDPKGTFSIEPIWQALEQSQRQAMTECWLITQPTHAALAGEVAQKLEPKAFGNLNESAVRAFALHDAGWSPFDAAAIQASRAKGAKAQISSFVSVPLVDTVKAWTDSIELTAKFTGALGGYLVSQHFSSIAAMQKDKLDRTSTQVTQKFLAAEQVRRAKYRANINQNDAELDRLLQALQFCDLLSLYLCCGLDSNVEFPQQINGQSIKLEQESERCVLTPTPFEEEHAFAVSGIRHPKTPKGSSATFTLRVR
jgi:hypothetical protein